MKKVQKVVALHTAANVFMTFLAMSEHLANKINIYIYT